MPFPSDPRELSLTELRRLVQDGETPPPPSFVAALAADPRKGARALARGLEGRRRARRREQDRLRRLLAFERELWESGVERIAGVDEAGMGPLAGPIVAAAVILSPGQRFEGLDDSKRLDPAKREELARLVRGEAVAFAIGLASVEDIARHDVYRAGLLAMRRAVDGLDPKPEHLLVDARRIPDLDLPQDAHVKGDARSLSIAAASVVAKTHRDALMAELDREHPGYGFASHQGYGTAEHVEALERLGPCAAHRTCWGAVAEHSGDWSPRYYELRGSLRGVADGPGLDRWRREASRGAAELSAEELKRLEQLAARQAARLPAETGPTAGLLPLD